MYIFMGNPTLLYLYNENNAVITKLCTINAKYLILFVFYCVYNIYLQ